MIEAIKKVAAEVLPQGSDLILFGSRARGDAQEDSDWDLLILLDNDAPPSFMDLGRYAQSFMSLGWENGVEVNPIIFTQDQWFSQKHSLFYHNVEEEGIRLWA